MAFLRRLLHRPILENPPVNVDRSINRFNRKADELRDELIDVNDRMHRLEDAVKNTVRRARGEG